MQNFKIQFTKSVSLHQTSFNERKLEQRILPQDIETEKRSNAFLVDHKWIFNNLQKTYILQINLIAFIWMQKWCIALIKYHCFHQNCKNYIKVILKLRFETISNKIWQTIILLRYLRLTNKSIHKINFIVHCHKKQRIKLLNKFSAEKQFFFHS